MQIRYLTVAYKATLLLPVLDTYICKPILIVYACIFPYMDCSYEICQLEPLMFKSLVVSRLRMIRASDWSSIDPSSYVPNVPICRQLIDRSVMEGLHPAVDSWPVIQLGSLPVPKHFKAHALASKHSKHRVRMSSDLGDTINKEDAERGRKEEKKRDKPIKVDINYISLPTCDANPNHLTFILFFFYIILVGLVTWRPPTQYRNYRGEIAYPARPCTAAARPTTYQSTTIICLALGVDCS